PIGVQRLPCCRETVLPRKERTMEYNSPSFFRTEELQPPDLDFRRRFVYDGWNDEVQEVEREITGPLMTPLMMARERMPRWLSPVAKENADGTPAQEYEKLLPPVDIAAVMISQHQGQTPQGAGTVTEFPFKLKAIGRVNAMAIFERAGQKGELVSPTVQIVP